MGKPLHCLLVVKNNLMASSAISIAVLCLSTRWCNRTRGEQLLRLSVDKKTTMSEHKRKKTSAAGVLNQVLSRKSVEEFREEIDENTDNKLIIKDYIRSNLKMNRIDEPVIVSRKTKRKLVKKSETSASVVLNEVISGKKVEKFPKSESN